MCPEQGLRSKKPVMNRSRGGGAIYSFRRRGIEMAIGEGGGISASVYLAADEEPSSMHRSDWLYSSMYERVPR